MKSSSMSSPASTPSKKAGSKSPAAASSSSAAAAAGGSKKKSSTSASPSATKKPTPKSRSKSGSKSGQKSGQKPSSSSLSSSQKSVAGSSSTAKKNGVSSKRKIVEIEKEIVELTASLDKKRKTLVRVEKQFEESLSKEPVRDELVTTIGCKGGPPLPIPEASYKLTVNGDNRNDSNSGGGDSRDDDNNDDGVISDLISVWDFINSFRKQLSLVAIPLDSFIELLKFTGRESPAITELFCSLLRLILSDSAIASKINSSLPFKVNFAHRTTDTTINTTTTAAAVDQSAVATGGGEGDDGNFDTDFNGLRLLPKKLRSEMVDALRWQPILRSIILRLNAVKNLRKAIPDIANTIDDAAADGEVAAVDSKGKGKEHNNSSPNKRRNSILIDASGYGAVRPNHKPNKDSLFLVTSDPRCYLEPVLEAAALLETKELHQLSLYHKIAVLKVLRDAAFSTKRLQELLERNADERANRITAYNRQVKEDKARQREVSATKKEEAVKRCREANRKAAAAACKSPGKSPKASPKGKGKGKGGKGNGKNGPALKGGAEPTPQQVQSMLEEMLLLESLGVDEVIDQLPIEQQDDDDTGDDDQEDRDFDITADGNVIPRNRASIRSKANDRKKVRQERGQRLVLVTAANELLHRAVETENEKDVRAAIRAAVKAGMRGVDEDTGNVFITELLKKVYKLQQSMELKAKEEKASNEYERALSEYSVRTEPIGEDRFHRRYWAFSHTRDDDFKLYVEADTTTVASIQVEVQVEVQGGGSSKKLKLNNGKAAAAAAQLANANGNAYVCCKIDNATYVDARRLEAVAEDRMKRNAVSVAAIKHAEKVGVPLQSDESLRRIIATRPSARESQWTVYASSIDLWALYEALDDRGERERLLKTALKARFDLKEPAGAFVKTGSEYVGKKVLRVFGKRRVYGKVIAWLPANGGDAALWRVVHPDGDEEDLEESELLEALVDSNDDDVKDAKDAKTKASSGGDDGKIKKSAATATASATADSSAMEVEGSGDDGKSSDDDDDDDDEPEIVQSNRSMMYGNTGLRIQEIGVSGLRQELLLNQTLLLDGLKQRGSTYNREGRKVWEASVKSAESVGELRSALLELEVVIRGVQQEDDERDEDEHDREKAEVRKLMVAEGWIFDNNNSNSSTSTSTSSSSEQQQQQQQIIGKHARRFFPNHGKSDGVFVAYLSADKNEGLALWRMEHDDGDEEDLDEQDVIKAIKFYDENVQEDADVVDEEEEEEGSAEGSEDEEEGSQEEDDGDDGNIDDGASSSRLWPTSGVRSRWHEALHQAKTIGEVALALSSLLEHARAFGVVASGDDGNNSDALSLAERRRAGSLYSSRHVGASHASSGCRTPAATTTGGRSRRLTVSKKSAGGLMSPAKGFAHGGRSQRAAAMRVISYAE